MSGTICDALMSNTPGELTFPINRELIGAGITASDAEVAAAVRYAFHELKLVVEPGGAIGLAALLAGKLDGQRQGGGRHPFRRQCGCGSVREVDYVNSARRSSSLSAMMAASGSGGGGCAAGYGGGIFATRRGVQSWPATAIGNSGSSGGGTTARCERALSTESSGMASAGSHLGHGVDAALQQVEQLGQLGRLRGRIGGIDLRAGEPYGDEQHAQIVAQALHGGGVGAQARLDAPDRGQQHLGVGMAVAPGIFGEEGAAARAFGERGAERQKVVLVGRVRRPDRQR